MRKIWTPQGLQSLDSTQQLMDRVNSYVGKGETIRNPQTGDATYVDEGTKGVDDQPSSVAENDNNVVLGNDIEWTTGQTFANLAAPHTKALEQIRSIYNKINKNKDKSSLSSNTLRVQQAAFKGIEDYHNQALDDLTTKQQNQHDVEAMQAYKRSHFNKGKDLPRYSLGKTLWNNIKSLGNSNSIVNPWEQAFGMAVPAANALAQNLYWRNQPVQYHNTYSENPYEGAALNELAKLNYSPYEAIQAATAKERQAAYTNAQAGGLTGAQRNMNRMALALGGMQNAASIYSTANEKNNAYRAQYANALMSAGQANRQARMTAAQHDWDDYIRANGARTKGIETSMINLGNIAQQYAADRFKIRMADKTLGLYDDQRKLDWAKFNSDIKNKKAK